METADFLAYQNHQFLTNRDLFVPVYDAGFVQGVTVAEQLRTFRGELFRVEQHLRRFRRSLEQVGIKLSVSWEELAAIAHRIARENHRHLKDGDDLGVTIFATPGNYMALAPDLPSQPTLCVHSQPLAFSQWADKYTAGQSLVISSIRQVSPRNWPTELKCRSRMHYYLADREAQAAEPGARALLLDLDGCVSEASTANVFAYFANIGFMTPRRSKILPGVTLDTLILIAAELEVPFLEADMSPGELLSADEVLLCSTSPCILPVIRIDGKSIGAGSPGPMYRRLLEGWSQLVGFPIDEQARQIAAFKSTTERFRSSKPS
jgi:branched-chain amino acid aminotransferase